MASSLVEKILGSNSIHTENYVENTLLLTKSIILILHSESSMYNELVEMKYKVPVDKADKTKWRYYLHLVGQYHPVDEPIKLVSWDSGQEIVLDVNNVGKHKSTREELLKFGSLYRTLVSAYPEQELQLRSILATSAKRDVIEVVDLPNHSIIAYNEKLIESQETDILLRLQERIDNYAITKTLPFYALAESLHMASLYFVLYNFIFTTLITLRLSNAQTPRAHSYHILSYLSSNHRLDNNQMYLDNKQVLFLYRNLKYLNTYAGSNQVFDELIDKFFTVRRVPVVNYRYKQKNTTGEDGSIEYAFVQKLLNNDALVFDPNEFSLSELSDKEITVLASNKREYDYHLKEIAFKNENSIHADVPTKNLEISIVDNSNDVKYELFNMTIDYWAQTLKLGINNHVINFTDPVRGQSLVLDSSDAFKLFTIVLHRQAGATIDVIPDYYASRVIKPILPTLSELIGKTYRPSLYLNDLIENVLNNAPQYVAIDTPFAFSEFVLKHYKYGMGTWLNLCNIGDLDMNAQVGLATENLYYGSYFKQDGETEDLFLKRIGFAELLGYGKTESLSVLTDLVKTISVDLGSKLEKNKYIQATLVEVLGKFKSYSTQLISQYRSNDSSLTNLGFPYFTLSDSSSKKHYYISAISPMVDVESYSKQNITVPYKIEVESGSSYHDEITIDISDNSQYDGGAFYGITVALPETRCLNDEISDWVITPPDQEKMLFLSINT